MSTPTESSPVKRRGCLFYGCLTIAILAFVLALCIGVGLYFAKRTYDRAVNEYTDTAPAKIEQTVYPEPQMRELMTRISSFQERIDKGGDSGELVLSADDLNALLANNPNAKGRVHVKIDDDQVKGQLSIPLPDIGPFKLKGRYLNGTAGFKVSVAGGRIDVRLEQVSVNDKPLPNLILSELKKQNLAKEIQADAEANPRAAKVLARIESLEIREGKVFIRAATSPTPAPEPAAPTPAPAPAPQNP